MSLIDILLEAAAAAALAGIILKGQSEEAAVEAEPIPVPVRDRH